MNGLERYHAALRGESVDFYPRTPILMRFAAEYIGHTYGEFTADHRVLVEANLRCAEDFDFDQVSTISDPYREAAGFGAEIVFHAGGPEAVSLPLGAGDEINLTLPAKPDPHESERMRDRVEAVKRFQQEVGGTRSILGWVEGAAAEAGDLRGVEKFMMDLFEEPEAAGELMDVCLETAVDFARAQIEAGADTMAIGDALVSQVSPEIYEQLILPRQKALVEAVRDMGCFVRLHICGNITHLLPGIATLPIHAIDADSMVDLAEVRRQLGPEVLIGANLDPVAHVRNGSPELIRQKMCEALEKAGGPGSRFANCAGCEIPPGTPEENLKALCRPIPAR